MKKIETMMKFLNSWTGTIIVVLLVIFFFIQAFTIPSGSMKNTLLVGDFLFVKKFSYGLPTPHIPWLEVPVLPDFNKNGHLLSAEGPKRGDIVVFRYPNDPKTHYVKRCVAKEGDEVVALPKVLFIRMSEGDEYMRANYPDKLVEIEGRIFVKEPYEKEGIHYISNRIIDNFPAMQAMNFQGFGGLLNGLNAFYFRVPQGEYFMVGDNRDNSEDSRFWGSVPYKFIVGKPWFVYFSWDEKKNIRWERIGRFVDTLQDDSRFIHDETNDVRVYQPNQ